MIREASDTEQSKWDQLLMKNPDGGHILQSYAWGEFKRQHGWVPTRLVYELNDSTIAMQLFRRKIAGWGSVWYCPKGPGVANLDQLTLVVEALKDFGLKGLLVKVEPELLPSEAGADQLNQLGLVKAQQDLQFKATIFVDLGRSEDDILADFKQKTRYNVRLAQKRGVEVTAVPPTTTNLQLMYELMQATQGRAKFFLRPKEYFLGYWKAQSDARQGQLFFAYHNQELLAGVFVTYLGAKGWYKDGGSFEVKRELMAPYLLQWEAMRWLKQKGVTQYDLVAVPPKDQLDNPAHPLAGLYQFKSGFSQEVTEFIGAWDLPLSRRKYDLWRVGGERIASGIYRRTKGDLLY